MLCSLKENNFVVSQAKRIHTESKESIEAEFPKQKQRNRKLPNILRQENIVGRSAINDNNDNVYTG